MSDDDAPTKSLREVIRKRVERTLEGVQTSMPGIIVSYDEVKQSASVQPVIYRGERDENTKRTAKKLPVINDVPVLHYGSGTGSLAFRVTVPVKKGDQVWIECSAQSLVRWKLSGKSGDPGDDRRHHISDAICRPGAHDFAHVPTTAPLDAMVLHGDKIKVGGPTGTQKTMMIDNWEAAFDAVITAIDAGITSGGGVAGVGTAWDTFKGVANRKTTKTEVK